MMTVDQGKPSQPPLDPPRRSVKLRSAYWLFAIGAVAIVISLAFWGVQMARDAISRKATRLNFQQVGLGLANYSEVWGHLPHPVRHESAGQSTEERLPHGTGRPLHSWRVEIVPYLECWHGSRDESQPWNHPANKQLVELSSFYAYDEAERLEGANATFSETNAMAITGPGTAFGDGEEPPKALNDVPEDTILVVECRASGIPWPAPGDFDIRTMPRTINAPDGKGISSRHPGGFHVIFADGGVWFLSDQVPFEMLEKFFTVAGAKKHDREKLLGPYALDRTT